MRLRQFAQCRRGNFAMMFAVTLPVFLGAVGLAVDYSTMVKAKTKLQAALDSAVLAASRINDKTVSREEVFQNFLAANLRSATDLTNIVADIDIEQGLNYIHSTGTAVADMKLYFNFLWGADAKKVSAQAQAYESTGNLEVVMALDNTGSMGDANMRELRKAATSLVDILITAHRPDGVPKREVRAALVPFVTAVNVKGEGYKSSWIDWDAKAKHHGENFGTAGTVNHFDLFSKMNVEWKGCVEARAAPFHLTDDAPDAARPDTLFVPYFAPDEPGAARLPKNSSTEYNNTYLNDMVDAGLSDRDKQRSIVKYGTAPQNFVRDGHASVTGGPNYACPTPIVPLTSDFTKLKSEIARMIHWFGSGTNVSEGLAWAYRVLSPREPYTQAAPYGSEGVSKFVVVFTDGENNVFGASNAAINKSDYGAYGYVDLGRMDTNRGRALTKVNDWTLSMCKKLKDEKVEVFTVLLGAGTAANRKLYSDCATVPENFYATSDVSKLDEVFKKIASKIARLYVSG